MKINKGVLVGLALSQCNPKVRYGIWVCVNIFFWGCIVFGPEPQLLWLIYVVFSYYGIMFLTKPIDYLYKKYIFKNTPRYYFINEHGNEIEKSNRVAILTIFLIWVMNVGFIIKMANPVENIKTLCWIGMVIPYAIICLLSIIRTNKCYVR